jgi:hypothetical protein
VKYCTAKWYILWPFCIVSVHFVYSFPVLVCLDKEKSGSPAAAAWFLHSPKTSKTIYFSLDMFCVLDIKLDEWRKKENLSCKQGERIGRIFANFGPLGECLLCADFF